MTENPIVGPFPASPYCQVRARVASIWADGPDDGTHPDWRPAVGEKVVLTPSIGSQLLTYDVGGADPIIVTVERVDCVVGDDGLLAKSDGRPVYIAPTDDPLMSVTGWTWTANIKGKSIVFAAPSGGVVDLALFIAAPATNDTKTWVERIPELKKSLVSIATITSDAGDMVVTLTDGESHRFPMPSGVPGHSPVVGLIGDRLTIDGVPVGGSLRGPAGAPGAPGGPGAIATSSSYLIVGPGRPDQPATTGGIITGSEPVGAEYRSTDGAGVGAWVWMKRADVGRPVRWVVTDGDTGYRYFDLSATWPEYTERAALKLRRVNETVTVVPGSTVWGVGVANAGAGSLRIPQTGFNPESSVFAEIYDGLNTHIGTKIGAVRAYASYPHLHFILRHDVTRMLAFELRWDTGASWPTTLPGTPA